MSWSNASSSAFSSEMVTRVSSAMGSSLQKESPTVAGRALSFTIDNDELADQLAHGPAGGDQLDGPSVLGAVPGVERHAQRMVDGGRQVLRTDRAIDHHFGLSVGGADDFTELDTAA